MSFLSRHAGGTGRKAVFYAKKIAWLAGLTSRFSTAVGPLHLPRARISPTVFYHLTNDDYEVPELDLLERHLTPDDRVVELGAGLGFLANVYGRRCQPQHHLAIEANPAMSALVRTNTESLGNIDVLNAIAARPDDGATTMPFYVYDDFWASSTQPIHLSHPDRTLRQTLDVPVIDLDALLLQRQCTLLVCDIEGGEAELLRSFTLDVPKILMELHWQTLGVSRAAQIIRQLESRGYRLSGSPEVLMAVRS